MQNKDQYLRSLRLYMPLQPATIERLVADCPNYQELELRLALEELGADIPKRILLRPRNTFDHLFGACRPFEVEFKETDEDELPHYEPAEQFALVRFRFIHIGPKDGLQFALRRDHVLWLIKLDSNTTRAVFDNNEPHVDFTEDSDEMQRFHVFKMIC